MARTVAGEFPDHSSARRALADLEAAGVEPSRTQVISAEHAPRESPPVRHFARTTLGAVAGSIVLGSIGAVIGWLAALLWPIHTLTSVTYAMVVIACVGGMIGWLIGGLAVRRVDVVREEYYRERAEQGRVILAVNAESREREVRQILARDGGQDVPPVTMRQTILPLFRSRRAASQTGTGHQGPAAT